MVSKDNLIRESQRRRGVYHRDSGRTSRP